LFNPIFKLFENPIKEKIDVENAIINKKLQGFQSAYQKYASGLMTMNSSGIIPPGHPLFSLQNSVSLLKTENDKLFKENIELKKKLDEKADRRHNP